MATGAVSSADVADLGSGYAVNDTGHLIQIANSTATYIITGVGGGGSVTSFDITDGGSGYTDEFSTLEQPTDNIIGTGTGFAWDLLAVTPPVSTSGYYNSFT